MMTTFDLEAEAKAEISTLANDSQAMIFQLFSHIECLEPVIRKVYFLMC